MEPIGLFVIIGPVAVAVFALGCWLGARAFDSKGAKITAGILCGLGAVVVAAGIAFAGCMALVGGFH